jgi:hypothetical protein
MPVTRATVTANAGLAINFHEFKQTTPCHRSKMRYAFTSLRIREDRWKNRTSNVVHQYHHTLTSLNYSVTIGPAPSVTISPSTDQWPAAVYTSFSH